MSTAVLDTERLVAELHEDGVSDAQAYAFARLLADVRCRRGFPPAHYGYPRRGAVGGVDGVIIVAWVVWLAASIRRLP
jgi:hypothetical protein